MCIKVSTFNIQFKHSSFNIQFQRLCFDHLSIRILNTFEPKTLQIQHSISFFFRLNIHISQTNFTAAMKVM